MSKTTEEKNGVRLAEKRDREMLSSLRIVATLSIIELSKHDPEKAKKARQALELAIDPKSHQESFLQVSEIQKFFA